MKQMVVEKDKTDSAFQVVPASAFALAQQPPHVAGRMRLEGSIQLDI